MTIGYIKQLIQGDESRGLELKKTTGELKDGMKTACAFLNTEGGYLIFGIAPTSLKIVGQNVTDNTQREIAQELAKIEPSIDVRPQYIDVPNSNGQQLIVFHLDKWKDGQVPYTYQGCPYYRIESTTKMMPRDMYNERLRRSSPAQFAWDTQVAEDVSISDLSEDRIRGAVRLGVAGGRINASAEGDSVETLLTKFKLMRNGKLTHAAVALFGQNVDSYPQLLLRMARFKGTDKMEFIDNKRATGNFFDLLDAGIEFCFKHLNLSGKIVGLRREEHLDIPVEALREALTNSLCHRRYDDPRTSVSLAIYDDRVEIVNPGYFTNGLTPQNIKNAHESYPYNMLIAQVLYLSTYLESWGTGVRRMVGLCQEQGLPEPEYQSDGNVVKIVFWKTTQNTTQKTAQKTAQNTTQKTTQKEMAEMLEAKEIELTGSQISILMQIVNNPKITRKEIEEENGSITADGVKYNIARLQELGLLRREGGRKNGQWEVTLDLDKSTTQKAAQKTTQNVQKTTQKEMTEMLEAKGMALTDSQISILTQIANNPKITRKEIEVENGSITADGVKYNIARLQELGLLRREGGRKNGQWEVTLDLG